MIGQLRGTLLSKQPPSLLIEVNGIGYEVEAPMTTFYDLPDTGSQVTLSTHLVVRDDAHLLYGFSRRSQRDLFRNLLRVNGVGPRVALAILSGLTAEEFLACMADEDVTRLTHVPGIGRKTAERLIVELRDRLLPEPGTDADAGRESPLDPVGEAVRALIALGYKPQEASRAVRAVNTDNDSSEEIIRGSKRHGGGFMIEHDRLVSAAATDNSESGQDRGLRPRRLTDFVGQPSIHKQMEVFIGAARKRGEALDHVLLFGPPGLGKTTLAHIIASEMGVGMRQTSGPVLERPGDLAALLTNLEPRDVLFVDEIHRLSPIVEEILYPALEDYQIDILIGEGPAARSIKLDLAPFTLVGATTRAGLLTSPLRDRFGIVQRLEFYTPDDLVRIVGRSARILGVEADPEGVAAIARRSRGTPRIANRLLRRVRDYAEIEGDGRITAQLARQALTMLDVDNEGFDVLDRKLLSALTEKFGGGPVGVDNLAAAIGEERGTIEDVIEPYLIQQGFLMRTPRGRVATARCWAHLGLDVPAELRTAQRGIFDESSTTSS